MNSRSPAISASLELGLQMGDVVPDFCVVFVKVGTWDPSSDPHVVVSTLSTKQSP